MPNVIIDDDNNNKQQHPVPINHSFGYLCYVKNMHNFGQDTDDRFSASIKYTSF